MLFPYNLANTDQQSIVLRKLWRMHIIRNLLEMWTRARILHQRKQPKSEDLHQEDFHMQAVKYGIR